ncbi:patatin-like phospholipase family protein [uncultured Proteiniphilum sp.]|uniref:patatin-like phospholipase family protein n=1 Tax=uncultured Proteiniphilum sp. TaxID=497637 RepID=UPI002606EE7C|nr:patatin-like phospholipase family protein [uncultured Proteiniphilum sp.]
MKRYIILFLSLLFFFSPVLAQRKKVGLVLSGGGAKGAAHVGVLKVLEEAGIPVDYIAGTSVGAIVGGLYSINHDIHTLDSMFRCQDWRFLFSDDIDRRYRMYSTEEYREKYLVSLPYHLKQRQENPAGLITGHNLYNLFSNMTVGYHEVESFNDLPIPFACVAVDLVSGKQVVLNKGSLPKAMRASMAIPGVLKPVVQDNMLLIDGGLLNNIPTDVVMDMGAEIIIGVDLSVAWKTDEEVKQLSGMLGQIMNIIIENENYEKNKNNIDLLLNPDLKGFEVTSFSQQNIEEMIRRGEEVARKHWDELILLKKQIYEGVDVEEPPEKSKYIIADSWQLGNISFDGISDYVESWLRKRLPIKENTSISMQDIEKTIAVLYGTDLFSQVEYQLGNDIPHHIHFSLKNKPLNKLNIGARFDSEEFASILLNTTINHQFIRGSIFSVTARLNSNPYLLLSEQIGNTYESKIRLSYRIRYNDISLREKKRTVDHFTFVSHSPEISYSRSGHNVNYGIGLHYDYFNYKEKVFYEDFKEFALTPEGFFNYFAALTFDSRDQSYYPTRGFYMNMQAQMFTDDLIRYKKDTPFFSVICDLNGIVSFFDRFCMIPSLQTRILVGNNIPFIYQNYMGGELDGRYLSQQISFPGIQRVQLFDNSLLIAKLKLRQRLWENHYVAVSGAYVNSSDKFDMPASRDIWGSSIQYSYNSNLGPVGLQLSYSDHEKRLNVFASIGYNF